MYQLVTNKKFLSTALGVFSHNSQKFIKTLSNRDIIEKFIAARPDLDFNYLCSPENTDEIKTTIFNRKGAGNVERVIQLHKDYLSCQSIHERTKIIGDLLEEALKIPNRSHPLIKNLNGTPKIVRTINKLQEWSFQPQPFEELVTKLNVIKNDNLTSLVGPRSYYLIDGLADLEEAIIQCTLNHLLKHNFLMLSVPDLLPRTVIEYCGMDTRGERTQVYSLDDSFEEDVCLSGTAEMGIAHFLQGKEFKRADLPLKFASVSRCFRAETSKISVEKGIYRVHQFTKVEMFAVTNDVESNEILDEFCQIQETLFSSLGLYLRLLDMPECELGAQAYRKFDIECYMPGKKYWGEVSSASNCTDYQSRRLTIKCKDGTFPHTINGTACAVPRLLIAILETCQNNDGSIKVPEVLVPYLGYKDIKKSRTSQLTPFKIK